MIKFANKTANIKYEKLPVYTTVQGGPSRTFKTAEIILVGHTVIERRMAALTNPCDVTPFNLFHLRIISLANKHSECKCDTNVF